MASSQSHVATAVAKTVSTVANTIAAIGKDIVTVVAIAGSVLAAAGGIVPPEIALYVTTGLLVLRTLGEDLEKPPVVTPPTPPTP